MSGWQSPPAEHPVPADANVPETIRQMPDQLVVDARWHYYRFIHHEPLYRALLVDKWNWQTGREIYIVPVRYDHELIDAIKRHEDNTVGARRTMIYTLFPGELDQYLPRPKGLRHG